MNTLLLCTSEHKVPTWQMHPLTLQQKPFMHQNIPVGLFAHIRICKFTRMKCMYQHLFLLTHWLIMHVLDCRTTCLKARTLNELSFHWHQWKKSMRKLTFHREVYTSSAACCGWTPETQSIKLCITRAGLKTACPESCSHRKGISNTH